MRRGEASPCGRARQSRVRRGLPRGMDSIGPCGRVRQAGVNRAWPSSQIRSPTVARDGRPGRSWALWPHYAGNQLTAAEGQHHNSGRGRGPKGYAQVPRTGREAEAAARADDATPPDHRGRDPPHPPSKP